MDDNSTSARGADPLSLLGFAVAVAGIAWLAFQQAVLCRHPLGIVVQALAVMLMVWARLTFGRRSFHAGAAPTAGGLVTSGPYRWWRHPIYAAILYFVAAAVACHRTWNALLAGGLVALGLAVRMFLEERLVKARYPEYAAYAARTRRVVPFLF
ncbi:MAG TPA: isoprenylcysteine carboxylmethyltransferase family protein [Thermoanaerobaculia bacterium]|jgi:protein-S-isoprenylcysteine O-methyltransferase Ste14|nr:isoprenylcysteine carboxylmethyltransferase family protein [Thermoanaerobaculia bacterium]